MTRAENAIETLTAMFERRIRAMIMEDFQGWEGTMESYGYKIQLNMDKVDNDDD